MPLRLYMDEDSLHSALIGALRRAGFDCLTTQDARRRRSTDAEQLAFATAEGRIVFTRNVGDFAALHSNWTVAGRRHCGIIVLTDYAASVGTIERAMLNLASKYSAEALENQLVFLLNFAVQ